MILTLAAAPRKPGAARLLVAVFAAYSGLYAARNLPVSSVLLVLIAAPLLSQAIAHAGVRQELAPALRGCFSRLDSFSSRMASMQSGFRGRLWPAAAVLLGLWVCLQHGTLGSRQLMDAKFDAQHFPVQAVEVLAQRGIREPILAPDYWGGYLIYRLYPQNKVVVDDRHDLYGEHFLKQYLKVIRIEPGWDQVLDEKRVNWILVPVGSSLANLLQETPPWKTIHSDNTAMLFHRGT
jgi:hypothetical protein